MNYKDESTAHLYVPKAQYDAKVASLQEQLAKSEANYKEAMRALESLTPGGSEFVGDPARCVEFVRTVRTSEHNAIMYGVKRAKKAEGE